MKAVQQFTELPIHHVIVVDFRGIQELVDALGGIDIDAPRALRSTFEGRTYQFPKGVQHLDGGRALAYAQSARTSWTSGLHVSRGQRGQQVIAAIRGKLASPGSIFRLRKVGESVADPLAADLTANEILQLGWVSWRAQRDCSAPSAAICSRRTGGAAATGRRRHRPRAPRVPRPDGGVAGARRQAPRARLPRRLANPYRPAVR